MKRLLWSYSRSNGEVCLVQMECCFYIALEEDKEKRWFFCLDSLSPEGAGLCFFKERIEVRGRMLAGLLGYLMGAFAGSCHDM